MKVAKNYDKMRCAWPLIGTILWAIYIWTVTSFLVILPLYHTTMNLKGSNEGDSALIQGSCINRLNNY